MITQPPSALLPLTNPAWQQWLAQVAATGNAIQGIDPTNPQFGKTAPSGPVRGALAYANGTSWNPGSGEGLYRWTGSAWRFIG
jgi:hypothetical protein